MVKLFQQLTHDKEVKSFFMAVTLTVAALSLGVLGPAQSAVAASIVDINLGSPNGVLNDGPGPSDITFFFGNIGGTGVDLTVSGGNEDGFSQSVFQDGSDGLGVFGVALNDNDSDVDGIGPDDRLIFSFSEAVTLLQGTFTNATNDSVALSTAAFSAFTPIQTTLVPASGVVGFGGVVSDNFVFGPSDFEDDFVVQSLQVEVSEAVPTPALLPGLIGMGAAVLRKRRKLVETTEAV